MGPFQGWRSRKQHERACVATTPPRGSGGVLASLSLCSLCDLGCDDSLSLHLLICKFQIYDTCFTGVSWELNEITYIKVLARISKRC